MRETKLRFLVAASTVLVLGACGGSSPTPAAQTTTPAATSPTEEPSAVDVTELDYEGALFTVDDLNGMLPGTYHTADEGDMAGLKLREQCAKPTPDPAADAGQLLELQDEEPSYSVTTSVHGFADTADATTVFNAVKEIASSCPGYESDQDTFERTQAPLIQPAGDDSFSFYASKTTTGLIVADHFVLRGPFVFDVRWAIASNSTMNTGISGVVIDQAVKKFIAWSDELL